MWRPALELPYMVLLKKGMLAVRWRKPKRKPRVPFVLKLHVSAQLVWKAMRKQRQMQPFAQRQQRPAHWVSLVVTERNLLPHHNYNEAHKRQSWLALSALEQQAHSLVRFKNNKIWPPLISV